MSGVLHKISFRAFYEAISYATHGRCTRVRVQFPYVKLGVATLLVAAPGRITSVGELADWIYGEKADGGPGLPEICVRACGGVFPPRRGVPDQDTSRARLQL